MDKLKIYTHPQCMNHHTGFKHPECPERLTRILDMIERDFPHIAVEHAFPVAEDSLLLAHPQSYLDYILDNIPFGNLSYLDGDTVLSPQSYDIALLAVGACCQAVDAVLAGECQTAFVAIRPPGHHAEYDKAMGFCLFANAFIAARHAQACHPVSNILIIDFDVHRGNGTADLVRRHAAIGRTDIAYASTHQFSLFPSMGNPKTEYNAKSVICDCPLPAGTNSRQFREIVTAKIVPFARAFKPELILFSAGFDAHESDPLGEICNCNMMILRGSSTNSSPCVRVWFPYWRADIILTPLQLALKPI